MNSNFCTCDRDIWPGLLLPPRRDKHGDFSVASVQEEVHGQLDSQTRENFLVPVAEGRNGNQEKLMILGNIHTLTSVIKQPAWNNDNGV